MLNVMTVRRVVISMPESLLEALNRVTAASPDSRSEIVCEAVRRYLEDQAEDFEEHPSASRPEDKIWIN